MSDRASCRLEVLEDAEALSRIAPEWDDLCSRAGPEAVFNRHAMIMANCKLHAGRRDRLHVATVRREGRLVLAAPLVIRRDLAGTRVIYWLHSRTPLYVDLLTADADREALDLLARHVRSIPLVRKMKVPLVVEGSPLHGWMASLGADLQRASLRSGLDLSVYGGWDDFLASRSAHGRRHLRYFTRRLEDRGAVSTTLVTADSEIGDEIAWIIAVKREQVLAAQGEPGWISRPGIEAYFRDVARKLVPAGEAFVLRLSCGKERAAALLCFHKAGTIFVSKIAFDPAFADVSPGWLAMLALVRAAFDRGAVRIDMMAGRTAWKERLANEEQLVFTARLKLDPLRFLCPARGIRFRA